MEKRCFYFLLVIFSFTSQVEGMFFEQSVTATIKIVRSNAVLNSLNQSFKHRGLNVRAFSEGLHTSRSSSSTYSFSLQPLAIDMIKIGNILAGIYY